MLKTMPETSAAPAAAEALAAEAPLTWADCLNVPGGDLFAKTRAFAGALAAEDRKGRRFFRRAILSPHAPRVMVSDPFTGRPKEMLMFGSNSFLGLSGDPRVVEASIAAARKYGYGAGAVSLYAGTTDLHLELERRIARFYRCEDAVLFPTGYAANIGAVSALLREGDTVVNDLFNHASIYDGCRLSGARQCLFSHGRMRHLESVLQRSVGPDHGTLVITDGVFSMEGSVARLGEIVALARRHGARVMVDEAHALGVVGPTGRGTAELHGLEGELDVTIGTLSKAPGAIGGYATGSKALVDYLRYYARTYFFSTALPAPVVGGLLEVFNILENEPERREALWRNIDYMVTALRELGFDLGDTASAIIPVIIKDEDKTKTILMELHEAGIFMNYVAFPAVPKRKCRLRLCMMAQHTRDDLDYTIETLAALGRKHGVI